MKKKKTKTKTKKENSDPGETVARCGGKNLPRLGLPQEFALPLLPPPLLVAPWPLWCSEA